MGLTVSLNSKTSCFSDEVMEQKIYNFDVRGQVWRRKNK
jgi:hypothetical protein